MLCYFGQLLFPCLNYLPIQANIFFFTSRTHRKNMTVSAVFKGCRKKDIFMKLVNSIVVGLLFCFHFDFCFVFLLSILKGQILPYLISRLFHLNEICDFIVSEQVPFQSQYQYVSGKSQKKETVRLSVYYDSHMNIICYDNHMLYFEQQNAFAQHLSCLTNDRLSLNAKTIADASKAQSKYVTRISVRVSIRCNITSKMTLAPY